METRQNRSNKIDRYLLRFVFFGCLERTHIPQRVVKFISWWFTMGSNPWTKNITLNKRIQDYKGIGDRDPPLLRSCLFVKPPAGLRVQLAIPIPTLSLVNSEKGRHLSTKTHQPCFWTKNINLNVSAILGRIPGDYSAGIGCYNHFKFVVFFLLCSKLKFQNIHIHLFSQFAPLFAPPSCNSTSSSQRYVSVSVKKIITNLTNYQSINFGYSIGPKNNQT